jgi:hypothetical protein
VKVFVVVRHEAADEVTSYLHGVFSSQELAKDAVIQDFDEGEHITEDWAVFEDNPTSIYLITESPQPSPVTYTYAILEADVKD